MAEGKKPNSNDSEFILWAIIAFLIFNALVLLPAALENRFGIEISQIINQKAELTESTPIGSIVIALKETPLSHTPGGVSFGTLPRNGVTVLISGPVFVGSPWWNVSDGVSLTGWVNGDDIRVDIARDKRVLKKNTPPGSKVVNVESGTVEITPQGGVIETKKKGARGSLLDGPRVFRSVRFWKVLYEDEVKGWVRERNLEIDVARNARALKNTTLIGSEVITTKFIDVFNRPGFNLIGSQREGVFGFLIDGPALYIDEWWWNVDYESGPDGWAKASALERHFSTIENIIAFGSAFKTLSRIVSVVFAVLIIFVLFRIQPVIMREKEKYRPISTMPGDVVKRNVLKNDRWLRALKHLDSENQNDWRLAILEADIMLDEMTTSMGLIGDSLGEKLKGVEKSDFLTIDKAWEAHKIRNDITHAGGEFVLTKREAERIVKLYEDVFKEFRFI